MKSSILCRCLAAGLVLAGGSGMQADDFDRFCVVAGGDTYEWPVGELRKITFTFDGKMNVESNVGKQIFDCFTLDKLYFSAQGSGIAAPDCSGERIRLLAPATVVFPQTPVGGRACIYRPDGTLVRVVDVPSSGGQVSLDGLSGGIYVIRYVGQTLKFIRP